MSEAGPEQVAVETPRPHRWLRRELWFVLAAVVAIAATVLAMRHKSGVHTAPGVPYGTVPSPAPVVAVPRPAPTAA